MTSLNFTIPNFQLRLASESLALLAQETVNYRILHNQSMRDRQTDKQINKQTTKQDDNYNPLSHVC